VVLFVGTNGSKSEKNLRRQTRLSEGRKPYLLVWEAYWKENRRDASRRFSENAYADDIAQRKAREARIAAQERLPNLRRSG
jgi:hypothetical protein